MRGKAQEKGEAGEKLSLIDAIGMAVGGMVGGGIFAVLGQAVGFSGNAAFIGFGIAGLLAVLTGISYSRLTVSTDEAGGAYVFVSSILGKPISGTLSWFIILGYIFTLSLYSYTFGSYGADLLGLERSAGSYLGVGILAALSFLNLRGVPASGVAEDALVYTKLAIIAMTAAAGLLSVTRREALPVVEGSVSGIIGTAALIFVAYEGFQLLTYDYDVIEDRRTNLGRSLMISIPLVTLVYMLVAFVTTGALSDTTISSHGETVLAYVARPHLGQLGITAVLVAALLSTASAINATIFAQARLANRVANDYQLPAAMFRWRSGGVGVVFVLTSSAIAAAVQLLGSLNQITTFASLVFLLVFGVVNLVAFIRRVYVGLANALPFAGCLGCFGALGMLVWDTCRAHPGDLGVIGGIALGLLVFRGVYLLVVKPSRDDESSDDPPDEP